MRDVCGTLWGFFVRERKRETDKEMDRGRDRERRHGSTGNGRKISNPSRKECARLALTSEEKGMK